MAPAIRSEVLVYAPTIFGPPQLFFRFRTTQCPPGRDRTHNSTSVGRDCVEPSFVFCGDVVPGLLPIKPRALWDSTRIARCCTVCHFEFFIICRSNWLYFCFFLVVRARPISTGIDQSLPGCPFGFGIFTISWMVLRPSSR